jgi:hypothetical protein
MSCNVLLGIVDDDVATCIKNFSDYELICFFYFTNTNEQIIHRVRISALP